MKSEWKEKKWKREKTIKLIKADEFRSEKETVWQSDSGTNSTSKITRKKNYTLAMYALYTLWLNNSNGCARKHSHTRMCTYICSPYRHKAIECMLLVFFFLFFRFTWKSNRCRSCYRSSRHVQCMCMCVCVYEQMKRCHKMNCTSMSVECIVLWVNIEKW